MIISKRGAETALRKRVVHRFWISTVPVMGILTVALVVLSLATYQYWVDGEPDLAIGHGIVAGIVALWWIWSSRSGLLTATRNRLVWQSFLRRSVPAADITDLEVVTGQSGSWTRSWPMIRTRKENIELSKFQVGLDSTDKLQVALDEMKVVLGLGDGSVSASAGPPLRVRRPTSWLFIAVLVVLVWLGINSSWVGLDLGGPVGVVAFGVGAAVVGYLISWLRGSSVVMGETSVRQVGGTERLIPIAEVVGFRVERCASGLTVAVLVVDTTSGEVVFDGMVATWGQTKSLEALAAQLNESLRCRRGE